MGSKMRLSGKRHSRDISDFLLGKTKKSRESIQIIAKKKIPKIVL
jgi:hypothetical protein